MRRLFVALACMLALTAGTSEARANHTYDGAHWPGGPAGLVMVSDRSGGLYPVDEVIAMWDQVAVYDVVNVGPVCPGGGPHYCLTIYADPSLNEPDGLIRGWADVHIFGDHILAADIRMSTNGRSRAAYRDVLAHEVGHGLGLAHRAPDARSVMSAPIVNSGYPDDHDWEQLHLNRQH